MSEEELNRLARETLDCAFRVHTALGPGLLESSYRACLAYELAQSGMVVETEVPIPLIYQGQRLGEVGYRLDILVEGELILEVKSVETIIPVHKAQLLSYLRLSNQCLGLLLNFNTVLLKHGIARIVNNL